MSAESKQKENLEYVPFPVELLPEPLKSISVDGAEALQCDAALVVLPVLSTVGAAIGDKRRIVIKEGWVASACIWTMFIAESGCVKTPAFRLAKSPLEQLEREENERFNLEMVEYVDQMHEYDARKKQFIKEKTGKPPVKPRMPLLRRFIVKDSTMAAVVEILRDNPHGILIPIDEIAGWFGSFNKHDQGSGDAQNWLSIYSGETISVDRVGKRDAHGLMIPTKVYSPFVAITGAIQPGLWRSTLKQKHQASGMAARFLMAFPPRTKKVWSEKVVSEKSKSEYRQLVENLVNLDFEVCEKGFDRPKFIGMSAKAKVPWVAYYNSHNENHLDYSGSLAAASAKIEEIAARLALLIHCVKFVTGQVKRDQVDEETMKQAIEIAKWFMREAERVYKTMAGAGMSKEDQELLDWIRLRKKGAVTPRELQRGKSGKFKTADDAEQKLNDLVEQAAGTWQHSESKTSGGRPTRRFIVATIDETPSKPKEKEGFVISSAGLEQDPEVELLF